MAKHSRKRGGLRLSPRLDQNLAQQAAAAQAERQYRPEPSDDRIWPYHLVKLVLFFLVLAAGAVIVWILPLRPTHSDVENRDLTAFPAYSGETLMSGDYFEDITLWFADTFPFREQWSEGKSRWQALYGIQQQAIYGPVTLGEKIPDMPTRPSTPATLPITPATEPSVTLSTDTSDTATTTTAPTRPTEPLTTTELSSVLVVGGSAFEYYSFIQSTADNYAAVLNTAAASVGDLATVYDMIVPTSVDVMLSADVRQKINSSDQQRAIAYMYGSMSEAVRVVSVQDVLRAHNSEYLYFNTDHHWTALGAYYAYAQFMQQKGIRPHAVSEYSTRLFDNFLGSFYSATQDAGLRTNADTVTAYLPLSSDATLYFEDEDGVRTNWNIITDVTNWSSRNKYNTFIGGDNAYTRIDNPAVTDGSSIIVIKESFGNAFVPFLVDHYQTVHVIDYRDYTAQSLRELVQTTGSREVLFINNISATRNEYLVDQLGRLVTR